MTPISTNPSRKRSRDDSAFDAADADGSYFPSLVDQVNTPAPIPEEPVYGEGMALLNPSTGQYISPESQTGTWYEEKALEQAQEIPEFRPRLPSSRKSVRLSQASVPSSLSTNNLVGSVTTGAPASPPKTATRPLVDAATLALGIGWSTMSEDPDIQAAARGWARYLENHYSHIHGAEILLKSEGLNAYLVGCQEGYYLFREDLLEGQLVGRSWEATLVNLRAGSIVFEGEETLRAERTPGPEEHVRNGHVSNGEHDDRKVVMQHWADHNRLNGDGSAAVDGSMDVD